LLLEGKFGSRSGLFKVVSATIAPIGFKFVAAIVFSEVV
jgi:hypothetical protein